MIELIHGDSLDVLKTMSNNSIDAIVTDPPYGLRNYTQKEVTNCLKAWLSGKPYETKKKGGFMGLSWDNWVPGPELWKEAYRVLKPDSYLFCFAGTRSLDLMTLALELSDFQIENTFIWLYSTGMPKGKKIDSKPFLEGSSQFNSDGWSTTLKPSWEPIIMAKKGNIAHTSVSNLLGIPESNFYYSTKATKKDRQGSKHPTVKPISLMRKLIQSALPGDGTILDPFAGSGTTGVAALELKKKAILIEKNNEYFSFLEKRFS